MCVGRPLGHRWRLNEGYLGGKENLERKHWSCKPFFHGHLRRSMSSFLNEGGQCFLAKPPRFSD